MKRLLSLLLIILSLSVKGQVTPIPDSFTVSLPGIINRAAKTFTFDMSPYASATALATTTQSLNTAIASLNSTSALLAATIAKAKNDSAMFEKKLAAVSVSGSGILSPIVKTANYTLQSSDNGRTIWMDCACTVTVPVLTGGIKCSVVAGSGTVTIAKSGTTTVYGSAQYIFQNTPAVIVNYKTSSIVDIK